MINSFNYIFLPTIITILAIVLNLVLIKKNFLLSQTGDPHQKFANKKNIPLVGGILIYLIIIYLFFNELSNVINILFFVIFLLGLFSDLKLLKIASMKLILQFFIIYTIVFTADIHLSSLRVQFLDQINENILFNYFFVTFCIVILINGTNFIDGLNGLVLGYFSIIFTSIYFLDLPNIIFFKEKLPLLLITFLILFLFNIFNKIFLGDNGSYLLGVFSSISLIQLYNNNNFSPFFIVLLLWYPCFELLFSIFRKFNFKKSPLEPDINHFHHLILNFIKLKYKYKNLICNILASLLILFYNFVIFFIGSIYIYNSEFQILLILLSIIIYVFTYLKLHRYISK